MIRPLVSVLAGFLLLAPAVTWAQRPPAYASSAAGHVQPLSATQRLERRFLQISAANMRFEAEASLLVGTHSNNPAVKELARAVLARQKTAQPEILHLLHARGMALPILGNEHNKVLKQLSRANGAKFDRLYIEDVALRSCQADVANFEKMATQAEDPVLKAWVERQLPMLRSHLEVAGRALPGASVRGHRAL
jgi:putative membrane protein